MTAVVYGDFEEELSYLERIGVSNQFDGRSIDTWFNRSPSWSHYSNAIAQVIWQLSWGVIECISVITVCILSVQVWSPTNEYLSQWELANSFVHAVLVMIPVRSFVASGLAFWHYRRTLQLQRNAEGPKVDQHNLSLPHRRIFHNLAKLSGVAALSCFISIIAVLVCTKDTCRFSSPVLWWMIFGVACIYLALLWESLIICLMLPWALLSVMIPCLELCPCPEGLCADLAGFDN
ncbi:hypothetical protein CPB83DRAFT_900658 [Crepidotus variabilis]|uniref:Transmembrane protein n=1 Tax=Crepidotus variabilis TaxID=179855 RepID=A0A9P6BCA4_9AGAR|nr:hypothetical protein CPB83DRAFT_900658 [Crepidotus variabilis]